MKTTTIITIVLFVGAGGIAAWLGYKWWKENKPSWLPIGLPGGECICPSCGVVLQHDAGVQCNTIQCPACASYMVRSV